MRTRATGRDISRGEHGIYNRRVESTWVGPPEGRGVRLWAPGSIVLFTLPSTRTIIEDFHTTGFPVGTQTAIPAESLQPLQSPQGNVCVPRAFRRDRNSIETSLTDHRFPIMASLGRKRACVKVAHSGVFLTLESDDVAAKWAELSTVCRSWAEQKAMPGIDLAECQILPMRTHPAWGEDMGPHFSVVSLPGSGTADLDGTPDPYDEVNGPDGKPLRVLPDSLRQMAEALAGKVHELDLSAPQLSFLLGSEQNDEATNGPVMVTAAHEAVRPLLDRVRAELGLKPFPLDHSVHTTLCKVTAADGDHAAFRSRLSGWPRHGRFHKKLTSLSEAFGEADAAVGATAEGSEGEGVAGQRAAAVGVVAGRGALGMDSGVGEGVMQR